MPDKLLTKDTPAPAPRAATPQRTRTQPGSKGAAKKSGGKGGRRTSR